MVHWNLGLLKCVDVTTSFATSRHDILSREAFNIKNHWNFYSGSKVINTAFQSSGDFLIVKAGYATT